MITIKSTADLKKIYDPNILPYVTALINNIYFEYDMSPGSSIEEVGTIFVLEQGADWRLYREMGLSMPVTESRFEWISFENGYGDGCIIVNNEHAINIIGKQEYFELIRKETQ